MDNHFNPAINSKLKALATYKDWNGMLVYLRSLSNSGFRTASYLLAERILIALGNEDYWACFDIVARSDMKAFLMTFLKAAVANYKSGTLSFDNPVFIAFAEATQAQVQSLDRQKTLRTILPILLTPSEANCVLNAFCGELAERQINYIIQSAESKPLYYVMFKRLQSLDNVEHVANALSLVMKRSTPLAFNFVSISRLYFGVEGMPGHFSLTLQPYELSRLESNYDDFISILTRMN